jgi:glycosyltransferase involved in cell wall biosynthesis
LSEVVVAPEAAKFGVVVIGRNEGERLARCFASIRAIPKRVYVDSGSTDGSVALARKEGIQLVELEIPPPFTAARARNAGLAQLLAGEPDLQFVQLIDGDCEMQSGWIESAVSVLSADPGLALVFGRRRERHPERSIYNALCDDEWNVPLGEASGVGGDALFRVAALSDVGFYNPMMIAGEDTELAMRLRKRGWRLCRIDAEMTLHDAALYRFSQWWSRTRRSGHGYGEMAFLHPDARDPNWPRTVRSISIWGGCMPALWVIAVVLAIARDARWWIAVALLLIVWPLNMARLARRKRRHGLSPKLAWASGILLMVGKLPQFVGLVGYHRNRLLGRASRLIEYKGPEIA